MANESKIEVIGNYLVVTDYTTNEQYFRKPLGKINYNRDASDVFYFTDADTNTNYSEANYLSVVGLNPDGSGRAYHPFADIVDSIGNPFASADALELFLATNLGATPVLQKNAPYLKTVDLGITGKALGAARTFTAYIGNSIIEEFGINDELYYAAAVGYDYDGGDVRIIIDFVPTGSEVGTEVQWELEYKTHDEGELISGSTGTLQSGDIPLDPTAYTAQDYNQFIIPAAQIKEEIHFRVRRIALIDGTDPAARPAVVHVHIQYNAKLN